MNDTTIGNVTLTITEPIETVSFNFSTTDGAIEVHYWHVFKFYDVNGDLISETAQFTSATEAIEVPVGASKFAIYYKAKHPSNPLIDSNPVTTAKYDIPSVDSDIVLVFGDKTGYTNTTVTITPTGSCDFEGEGVPIN